MLQGICSHTHSPFKSFEQQQLILFIGAEMLTEYVLLVSRYYCTCDVVGNFWTRTPRPSTNYIMNATLAHKILNHYLI